MVDNVNLTAGDGTVVAAADDIAGVKYPRVKATWGPDGTATDADVASGHPLPVQLRGSDGTDRSNLMPISAASLPLPAGASTSAKQPALGTAGTPSADVLTVQGATSMTPLKTDASATTQPISAASLPLPALAATSTKQSDGSQKTQIVDGSGNVIGSTTNALDVNIKSGSSSGTEYTEDAAAAANPAGGMLIAVRRDTLSSSEVSADGDNIALKATDKGKLHVAAELRLGDTVADTGSGTGGSATQRIIMDSSQLAALATAAQAMSAGFQLVGLPTDQPWPKGLSPRAFAATFSTLTRPANTTAYSAGDSISNNATAASVTALSATVSDTNDDPITITEILVTSTDTGLAGKKLRAYLFNSDPTASSGVGAGDNAAFQQKVAGYIGSFMGWMETGFSDGTVGRLVPCFNETNNTPAGGFVVALPTTGAKTLYIQFQAVEAFTPSANSTTIIAKAKGYQGRAG